MIFGLPSLKQYCNFQNWCLVRYPFTFTSPSHSLLQVYFSCNLHGYHTVTLTFLGLNLNIFIFWISIWKASFWFSVLVFGKISLLLHFIFTFLAGNWFSAIYMYIILKLPSAWITQILARPPLSMAFGKLFFLIHSIPTFLAGIFVFFNLHVTQMQR